MSVYDGYTQVDTSGTDFEAEAIREAALKMQVRELRQQVREQAQEIEALQAAIADLLIRVEDLEAAHAGDEGVVYVLTQGGAYTEHLLNRAAVIASGGDAIAWPGLLHYELADRIRDLAYEAARQRIALDDGHILLAVLTWKWQHPGVAAYVVED